MDKLDESYVMDINCMVDNSDFGAGWIGDLFGNYINKLKVQLAKYKTVWTSIKDNMNLVDEQDPCVQELLPDARREPFSGVWYQEASGEEEIIEDDTTVEANIDQMVNAMEDVMNMEDREKVPQAPHVILRMELMVQARKNMQKMEKKANPLQAAEIDRSGT